jgi:hypothetical protein
MFFLFFIKKDFDGLIIGSVLVSVGGMNLFVSLMRLSIFYK